METGIMKILAGYQVWFKIDNQTFYLEECIEDTDKDSLETAQLSEKMLKVAFKKLDINIVSEPLDTEIAEQLNEFSKIAGVKQPKKDRF